MKKIAVILVLLISGCMLPPAYRMALDPDEQNIIFIDTHGKSKNDAFVAAHAWTARAFRSANDVIQMNDKEAGMLIVKSAHTIVRQPPAGTLLMAPEMAQAYHDVVPFTLTIQVKDQKMKMEFMTGTISLGWGAGRYPAKEDMPGLLEYYKKFHDDMTKEIAAPKVDF